MDQLEEVDFEELETRLYSQVFHGSNENEESTIINRDLGYEKSNPKRYRYFESEIPVDDTVDMSGKHFKNNVMVTPNSATIFTDSSCGHVVQNNITVNQYTLPVEDFLPTIGYNNHVALPNYHKRSGSNKLYQRIARERKKILKELRKNDKQKKILEDKKKSTPKVVNTKVIFISDDESDDECVVVQEDSEIPDKQTDVIEPEKNNEEVSDDDITYIPPPPIEVINIDDDNGPEFENIISCPLVSSEKNANDIFVRPNNPESSESVSKKNYHPKEHHELLHTPEPSTSNDFLDNTSLEQNSSPNFNFSLHGSDFNNQNDFSVYANPVEYCETESSCSANDPSREINNSVKTIVFDEVDFPRSDIFSENNLESFKTLITPQRRSDSKGRTIKAHLEKSPSKAIENKKSSSDSSSSESDFDQRDFNNALPDLSVMQPSDDTDIQMPSKEKKEKSKKNKKKTIKKKKKKVEHIMESPLQSMKRKKDSTEISVKKKKVLDEAKSTPCSKKKKNNETMKILSNSEKVKKKKKRLLESPLPPKFTENNDAELNDSEINTVQSNDLIIVDSTDQMNLITINEDSSDIEIIAESTVTQQDADTTSNEPNVTPSSETIHNTSVAIVNQLKKFDASFDIQAIQENQSDDPQKWKICDKDENIYCNFDEPGKRGPRCNRCRHFGHYASKCTEKTYPPRCTLCGDDNHKEPRCPKKMCFQCGRKGDYSTNYCWRCFKFRYSICKQCNMPGHLEKLCPDLWRRYHLTTETGPIVVSDGQQIKPRDQQWCSGCAKRGHLEHECNYYNRQYPPSTPFIVNYEDVLHVKSSSPPAVIEITTQYPTPSRVDEPSNPVENEPNISLQINSGISLPQNEIDMQVNTNFNQLSLENLLQASASVATIINQMKTNFNQGLEGKASVDDIEQMMFCMPVPVIKQFLEKEINELAEARKCNPRFLKRTLTKYATSTSPSLRDQMRERHWYKLFNMYFFGVHKLEQGWMHLRYIHRIMNEPDTDMSKFKRNLLFNAYKYIFGNIKHPEVNYMKLLDALLYPTPRKRR